MATEIRKVGVIGAGQMGSGIAQVCALAGLDVVLNDVSEDRVKAGLATINGNMARQISKKRITEEQRQTALGHIASSDTFDKFGDCDLVIEAVTEREDVKRKTLSAALPGAQAGRDDRHQHVVDLDHAARRVDRPAGKIHRHSFHESGGGDGAGRTDPRHRDRRSDIRDDQDRSSASSARRSRCRKIFRPSSSTASCCR